MRSVQDISMFPNYGQKFQSPKGDSTFSIVHGTTTFIVDVNGFVISPTGSPLDYFHSDIMTGLQSGYSGTVKDFLTVDPSMDSPGSVPY
jgi:hypothetical protein